MNTRQLRSASLIAGVGLALMAVIAAIAVFGAISPLIAGDDAAKIAQNIAEGEAQFRWGIAGVIVVVILDIVVAAALLTLFSPVDRQLAIVAAWFRVAYAAVYLVAILQLVIAVDLLDDPEAALRAIDAYRAIWLVGLILFGFHLLAIGYLAYRSGFMARVFGILLVVAGAGYIVDGFLAILAREPVISVGQFTFVGEVAFIGWLLIRGRRIDFGPRGSDSGYERERDSSVSASV